MNENNVVSNDMVVGLAYTLYVDDKIADSASADDPLEYLHGHGNIIPGLESGLEGLKVGDKKTVVVTPDEGYGEYDSEATCKLEKNLFPESFTFTKGQPVSLRDDATGQQCVGYIVSVDGDEVTLDLNHPMAGKTLRFENEIISIRPATEEEIAADGIDTGCCSDCSSCHGCD